MTSLITDKTSPAASPVSSSHTTTTDKVIQAPVKPKSKCNFLCSRRINLVDKALACGACKKAFCVAHRIPEKHKCTELEAYQEKKRKELDASLNPKEPKRFRFIEDEDCDGDC